MGTVLSSQVPFIPKWYVWFLMLVRLIHCSQRLKTLEPCYKLLCSLLVRCWCCYNMQQSLRNPIKLASWLFSQTLMVQATPLSFVYCSMFCNVLHNTACIACMAWPRCFQEIVGNQSHARKVHLSKDSCSFVHFRSMVDCGHGLKTFVHGIFPKLSSPCISNHLGNQGSGYYPETAVLMHDFFGIKFIMKNSVFLNFWWPIQISTHPTMIFPNFFWGSCYDNSSWSVWSHIHSTWGHGFSARPFMIVHVIPCPMFFILLDVWQCIV